MTRLSKLFRLIIPGRADSVKMKAGVPRPCFRAGVPVAFVTTGVSGNEAHSTTLTPQPKEIPDAARQLWSSVEHF